MVVIALAAGAEGIVWYDFKDDGLDVAYNEHNFGLVHHEEYLLAPKPAYVAYAHLIAALRGRELLRQEVTPDGLWKTTFEGKGSSLDILFTAEPDQVLTVRVPPGARVEDMFGQPVPAGAEIDVTSDPIFVIAEQ